MSTKRDECCWCTSKLNPEVKHYWGKGGRTRDNFIYPDLCPKCSKDRYIRKRFDGFKVSL